MYLYDLFVDGIHADDLDGYYDAASQATLEDYNASLKKLYGSIKLEISPFRGSKIYVKLCKFLSRDPETGLSLNPVNQDTTDFKSQVNINTAVVGKYILPKAAMRTSIMYSCIMRAEEEDVTNETKIALRDSLRGLSPRDFELLVRISACFIAPTETLSETKQIFNEILAFTLK